MTTRFNPPKPAVFKPAAQGPNLPRGAGILQARAQPLRSSPPLVPPVFRVSARPLPVAAKPAEAIFARPPNAVRVVQRAAHNPSWAEQVAAKKAAKAGLRLVENKATGDAAREEANASAMKKLAHMAGDEASNKTLTGGHLLTSMKAKHGTIWLDKAPNNGAVWGAYWAKTKNDQVHAKWSSFFPALWTEDDVIANMSSKKVAVQHKGETMFPTGCQEYKPAGTMNIQG